MKITLVTDNPDSWIMPYVDKLKKILSKKHTVQWVIKHSDIPKGDCAFFLSCSHIVKPEILKRNKHNLVVHESALPKGKGWSPLTWQILEGKNTIPITLFEAAASVDSGDIYLRDSMHFQGDELLDELRQKQGEKTIELVAQFVKNASHLKARNQKGLSSYYPKRGPKDSELLINKTIQQQFHLLRVADNVRYPAFFYHKGHKYIVKIYKDTTYEKN